MLQFAKQLKFILLKYILHLSANYLGYEALNRVERSKMSSLTVTIGHNLTRFTLYRFTNKY